MRGQVEVVEDGRRRMGVLNKRLEEWQVGSRARRNADDAHSYEDVLLLAFHTRNVVTSYKEVQP